MLLENARECTRHACEMRFGYDSRRRVFSRGLGSGVCNNNRIYDAREMSSVQGLYAMSQSSRLGKYLEDIPLPVDERIIRY